jgi:hypothetical protein
MARHDDTNSGSSHAMSNELSHSKEVAQAALCGIHGFGMALLMLAPED